MSSSATPINPLIPFAVAASGIAFFSMMDAVMKGLTLAIGAYNAVFWRAVLGVPISGIFYAASRPRRPTRPALRLHMIRSAVTSAMAIAFFWGLARMPMAEAIALCFVAPIIALFLAALILREKIGREAILASVAGFAGVLLIVWQQRSGGGAHWWGVAAILGSALLYAYNIVLMRQQAQVAGPLEVTFFQNLVVALLLVLMAPRLAHVPAIGHLPALVAASVLACLSLLLLAWAYRRAEAQHLAPVEYTTLIWAAALGYVFFDEALQASTLFGAALIVAGCLVAARAQRQPVSPVEAAL